MVSLCHCPGFYILCFEMEKGQLWITKFEDLEKINPFEEIKQKRGNLIQTKNLKKLCNDSKHFLHGVDYLRGVLSNEDMAKDLRNLPIFDLQNDSNSSEIVIEGYSPYYIDYSEEWTYKRKHYISVWKITVQKIRDSLNWEKFIISLTYEDLSVPVIEINFYYWENNSRILQNWIYCMIEFKGKPFRLEVATCGAFKPFEFLFDVLLSDTESESKDRNQGLVYGALKDSFDLRLTEILASFKLTRIDYRFDFFLPKGHFWLKDTDIFKNLRSSNANYSSSIYEKKLSRCPYGVRTKTGRNYTGWKHWNTSKYIQTRFYQKQVDTWLKWWSELYPEYMNFDWEVWRLEFQCEGKFCNARTKPWERYNFFDEFEDKKLTKQIFEFVWINEKKGSFCQRFEPVSLSLKRQPYSYQRRFFTRYKNDTVKLVNNWFNPLDLIDMALNNEQIEKLKDLNSREKILNAFAIDLQIRDFTNETNWDKWLKKRK